VSTTSGHYKRYLVSGKALFQAETGETTGELVDISRGGVRIRSKFKPLEGEEIAVRFTLKEYSEVFQVRGMVVGVQSDSWAVLFFEEPVGLAKLLGPLDEMAQKQVASPIDNRREAKKLIPAKDKVESLSMVKNNKTKKYALALLFLSAAIGAVFSALSDIVQKDKASAIVTLSQKIFASSFPPIYVLILVVALAAALCFVFEPETKPKAFYLGASVLALAMTLVPYQVTLDVVQQRQVV